ncbi:hypothetical protein D3C87_1975440 [compost metagenome]
MILLNRIGAKRMINSTTEKIMTGFLRGSERSISNKGVMCVFKNYFCFSAVRV